MYYVYMYVVCVYVCFKCMCYAYMYVLSYIYVRCMSYFPPIFASFAPYSCLILYVIVYRELIAQKAVPHRDFYNVRKVRIMTI